MSLNKLIMMSRKTKRNKVSSDRGENYEQDNKTLKGHWTKWLQSWGKNKGNKASSGQGRIYEQDNT